MEREQANLPVDWDEIAVEVGVSRTRLDELMAYNGSVSLELESAPGQSLKDVLVFEGVGSDPERQVAQQSCMDRCLERIPRLEPRQQYILNNHYGLVGDSSVSLSQIGRDLGLSRERVRQLQKDALRRISRHL